MLEDGASKDLFLRCQNVWLDPPGRFASKSLLIRKGRIFAIGQYSDSPPTDGSVTTVDLGAYYLLPGLINTHVHLEFSASSAPLGELLNESPNERLLRACRNANQMLRSGVTTARDCGSSLELLALARRPDLHPCALPRLLLSGPPITNPRGHLHFFGGEAASLSDVDLVIDRTVKAGALSVKLIGSGGGMTPHTFPERPNFSQDIFDHVAGRARAMGLPSVVHVLPAESIKMGALARFDSLEHCAFFSRDKTGELVRNFDPNIANIVAASGSAMMANLSTAMKPPKDHRRSRFDKGPKDKQFELMLHNFEAMHKAGIPMVCGTDAGVRDTPFSMTWAELAWMEQAGMAAREAIGTATRNAARVLKIDGETGSIAPGLSADLIVLGRSPLEDLAAFVSPHAVLLKGMWMRHATSVMSEKSDA